MSDQKKYKIKCFKKDANQEAYVFNFTSNDFQKDIKKVLITSLITYIFTFCLTNNILINIDDYVVEVYDEIGSICGDYKLFHDKKENELKLIDLKA